MVTRSRKTTDDEIFERQARICKAFAHPGRLRILDLVGREERGVSDLQRELGVSKANISQQISILKSGGRPRHSSQWETDLLFARDSGGETGVSVDTPSA